MTDTALRSAERVRRARPSLLPAQSNRRDRETQTSVDLAASPPLAMCEESGEVRRTLAGGQVRTDSEALVHDVYCRLSERLPGRIRDLRVEPLLGNSLAISGVASSYYVKQVAQHVAMEVARLQRVINQIEVRVPR
ncbi:MAG: hypothetical protein KDA44_14495 [Planctomycetales bacterium]|nr:hypothetical protein [Planctomycetales bacterium]